MATDVGLVIVGQAYDNASYVDEVDSSYLRLRQGMDSVAKANAPFFSLLKSFPGFRSIRNCPFSLAAPKDADDCPIIPRTREQWASHKTFTVLITHGATLFHGKVFM